MANGQGLYKQTVMAKQSGLGVPATTGGQIMRRRSSNFTAARDTYENDEIASHQQSTGATAGIIRTSGKLDALLSPGTYSKQFQSLLRKDFAAITAITAASITIAGSGPTYTVTRAAGSFLTDGIKIGHVVRLSVGALNAANINKNLLVLGVTALVLTVKPLNGVALVAEGPIATTTVSVPGKVTYVPTTGHTKDYWSCEEWYADLTKSELFTDVGIASAEVGVPATGNATASFDLPGLARTRGTSQTIVSPAVESTTNVVNAVAAAIIVNGVVTAVTGASFTINGNIAAGEAEVGSNSISDLIRGDVAVTGQFTSKFSGTLLQDIYDQQSVVGLIVATSDSALAAADFVVFSFPAIKLFGDAPDDGEAKEIVRTYPFTAQLNSSGGAALASHQTIVQMQDSQAA